MLGHVPFVSGRPSVIAHTVKGKGVSFMENNLDWHYKSPNATQLALALRNWGFVHEDGLHRHALPASGSRRAHLAADRRPGLLRAEALCQAFPRRYVNVGVAEQNLAGIAAGLARCGKVPFIYSIANFPTLRCLEQIRNDICYHEGNVKIVAVGAGFSYGTKVTRITVSRTWRSCVLCRT